jgi:TolA-binding protein
VRELADLATQDGGDPQNRSLEVGILLRDMAGDPQRSAQILSDLQSRADSPEMAARAALELGRSDEALALTATLDGEDRASIDRAWSAASSAYRSAAGNGSSESVAGQAKVALVRMALAEAAQPEQPSLFDADTAPVYQGVGEQEALPLDAAPWPALSQRIRELLETVQGAQQRSWLFWRSAEITVGAELDDRIAWVGEGLSLGPGARTEPGLRYTLGLLLLDAGRAEEAANQLRKVMENENAGDTAVAARYAMAEIQRGARRYTAAQELYAAYAGAFPSSQRGQRALLLAGDMALYAGNADQAADDYRALLARFPEGIYADDAAYRLGTAQMRRGRYEDARSRFQSLAAQGSASRYAGRSLVKLSELESRVGNDSLAVDALERLTAVDPELAVQENAPLRIAQLELDGGHPQEALRWLDRIVEDPISANTLSLRIRALARAGKLGDASKALDRLSEGYPESAALVAQGRCDLADAYLAAGRSEDALNTYAQVEQEPAGVELRARALYGRGMALLKLEKFSEARTAFEDAARAAPKSEWAAESLYKVGNLAARQGEDEAARDAYALLAEDFPDNELAPDAMKGLAMSYRRLGRYDKALEVYHELLENYPEMPDADAVLSSIAYCYHEMGRWEVCIAAYERVLPLLGEEDQAYAQFWIADSLEQLQRYDEAAAAYLKIPYLYPKSGQLPVTAQLKAAGVYEKTGDLEAASTLYQKVISAQGRNSQWGTEALRRLERIQAAQDGSS